MAGVPNKPEMFEHHRVPDEIPGEPGSEPSIRTECQLRICEPSKTKLLNNLLNISYNPYLQCYVD